MSYKNKKKNNNSQSNSLSSQVSNDKTPQKLEEDKIVWFTSPPIDKLKSVKLNSEKNLKMKYMIL
jgi:hypothetical protein